MTHAPTTTPKAPSDPAQKLWSGMSLDLVLWTIAAILVVIYFATPDGEVRQWVVWSLYTMGGISLLNSLRPRK